MTSVPGCMCAWMSDDALKLNAELVVFRSKDIQLNEQSIQIGSNVFKESAHVRILAVTLDRHMSFEKHTLHRRKSCNT